jgi:hypothetical protein
MTAYPGENIGFGQVVAAFRFPLFNDTVTVAFALHPFVGTFRRFQ